MMKMIKLGFHSMVDVITNSSTTIFTYSDGSVAPAMRLVDEILKLMGSSETANDIFYMDVFVDDDYYSDHLYDGGEGCPEGFNDLDWKGKNEFIDDVIQKVLKEEIERPEWMIEVDNSDNYDGYRYPTTIYILPKDVKYQALAEKLDKFLYSTSADAFRDG